MNKQKISIVINMVIFIIFIFCIFSLNGVNKQIIKEKDNYIHSLKIKILDDAKEIKALNKNISNLESQLRNKQEEIVLIKNNQQFDLKAIKENYEEQLRRKDVVSKQEKIAEVSKKVVIETKKDVSNQTLFPELKKDYEDKIREIKLLQHNYNIVLTNLKNCEESLHKARSSKNKELIKKYASQKKELEKEAKSLKHKIDILDWKCRMIKKDYENKLRRIRT